jgi:excisionase family DNA binding protein
VERARENRSSVEEPVVRQAEPSELSRLLTLPEVAGVLQVSPKTVRRLVARGFPHIRFGRVLRFDQADVHRWLVARRS